MLIAEVSDQNKAVLKREIDSIAGVINPKSKAIVFFRRILIVSKHGACTQYVLIGNRNFSAFKEINDRQITSVAVMNISV